MVIYALYHGAHFHKAILHRLMKNSNDTTVLLLSNTGWHIGNKIPNMDDIVKLGLFDKVIFCDMNTTKYVGLSEDDVECEVTKVFDDLFALHEIDIFQVDRIENFIDGQNTFGLYLMLKKIRFYQHETGFNAFYHRTSPNVCKSLNLSDGYGECMVKYGLLSGDNEYITPVAISGSRNVFENKKQVDVFDFEKALADLDDMHKKNLASFYMIAENCFSENYALFSPSSGWHSSNAHKKSVMINQYKSNFAVIDSYNITHQLVLDYNEKSQDVKMIFKPHPSNPVSKINLERYFNDVVCLPAYFATELMPLFNLNNLTYSLGTGSSANRFFQDYCCDNRVAGHEIYYYFYLCHKLYGCFLIHSLVCNEVFDICHYGLGENFLKNFATITGVNYNIKQLATEFVCNDEFTILNIENDIKRVTDILSKASSNAKIIFVNKFSEDDFILMHTHNLLPHLLIVTIQKQKLKEYVLDNLQDEKIYIFCKNPTTREAIRNFQFRKTLKYTGIEIYVEPTTELQSQSEMNSLITSYLYRQLNDQSKHIAQLDQRIDELVGKLRSI